MSRPHRARALAVVALALGATACQDYNFNPVGHCLIQTGSERFTLSGVSSADVLFVVDDSGSMQGEQAALAANFDSFIENLTATNVARKAGGLDAIDFHIAVTTSSVYFNQETQALCSATCGAAAGTAVCCQNNAPARIPRKCPAGPTGTQCAGLGTGVACRLDCNNNQGEFTCCDSTTRVPPTPDWMTCSRVGTGCGTLQTHYSLQGCTSSITQDLWPFPAGDFVSWSATPGTSTPNPRVLHFDKSIYTSGGATGTNAQGFTSAQLEQWFKQNVQVGTCGSGQEQALQAGRLAVQKGLAGLQADTRTAAGAVSWTPPTVTALPGSTPAGWPKASSKLVVVFVGDEDDCSAPKDPSGGVVMLFGQGSGNDACTRDAADPAPLGQKEYPVSDFVSFFTGLGRPVAAGFILPAAQTSCSLATCTDAGLCCPVGGCTLTEGAQARGKRLLKLANDLSSAGVEVVAGSICDPNFGTILNDIAEIVKPPETLELPSIPAEGRIAILRIIGSNGDARICGPALAPQAAATLADARATHADWWFVTSKQPGPPATDPLGLSSTSVPYPTKFVYINPDGSCRANFGETYSADFIGVSPAPSPTNPTGGCVRTPGTDPDGALDCQTKLGGPTNSYECFVPPGLTRGTCTCKSGQ